MMPLNSQEELVVEDLDGATQTQTPSHAAPLRRYPRASSIKRPSFELPRGTDCGDETPPSRR
jgi:hypothetical protein